MFLAVLIGTILGFWYFESSNLLKIIILILAFSGLIFALRNKKTQHFASKFELLSLLILYLGVFTIFNMLYIFNLPLYAAMIVILALVTALFYSTLSLDQADHFLPKEIFQSLILLLGLVILEIFLGLYFWPIDFEAKSLILVIVFYLIVSLIYLYIHSMLRLRKILGYVVVSIFILAVMMFTIYLRLPR